MCRFCDELKSTGHAQLVTAHHIQQLAVMLVEFPEDVVAGTGISIIRGA